MSKRAWIKIYCQKVLETDISADLSTFGAWIKLLCIAGDSSHGDIGVLQINDKLGLSDQQIGHIMHLSARQWRRYKDIFVRHGMIEVKDKNIIIINNWSKYQSEYGRQKSYRQGYKNEKSKVTSGVTSKVTPRDKRVEKENKEKEIENVSRVDKLTDGKLEHIGEITGGPDFEESAASDKQKPKTTDIEPF